MSRKPKLPRLPNIRIGFYTHYKGGVYEVVGVARHSETLAPLVIYSHNKGWWARPAEMFKEKVVVNGKKVPRFSVLERS